MHVAFVADGRLAVGGNVDVALNVVRVHIVGAHPDRARRVVEVAEVAFRNDEIADQAARFANVHLARPVAVVGEFVFGEPPFRELGADFFRDARVVLQRPHQALLPVQVRLVDRFAFFVSPVRITVIAADVVGRNRFVVVRVGLVVRHRREVREDRLTGFDGAEEDFVLFFVVIFRFFKGRHIPRVVGEAHAEVVRLNAVVALAVGAVDLGVDERKKAAVRIAALDVRVDRPFELVINRVADLNPVQRFAVLGVRFAPGREGNARRGHKVAFVSRVDKDFTDERFPGKRRNRADRRALFDDAFFAVKAFVFEDGNLIFGDEIFEHLLGDVGFEDPHRFGFVVDTASALARDAVLTRHFLERPSVVVLVVEPKSVVEFARQPADDGSVAGVGGAESAAREAAEVFVGRDDDDRFAHFLRLDGGRDRRAGSAVNDDVIFVCDSRLVGANRR